MNEDMYNKMSLLEFVETGHQLRQTNPEKFETTYPLDELTCKMIAMKLTVMLTSSGSLKITPVEFNMDHIFLMKIPGLPRFMVNCDSWAKNVPCDINAAMYRAPEMSQKGDAWTLEDSYCADVWGMGAVLFKVATGVFYDKNPDTARAHLDNGIPLSDAAKTCILQMLNAEPSKRPEADQLLAKETWVSTDLPKRGPPPASQIVKDAIKNGEFRLPVANVLPGAGKGIRRPTWPAGGTKAVTTTEDGTIFNGYVWDD